MQVNLRHLSAINKYAASTEATRYYLNGVYIHTDASWVYAVATDGHRMIVHRFPNAENVDWNFTIPSRAFNSFKFKKNDLGLGEMNFQNGEIVFSVEGDITRVKRRVDAPSCRVGHASSVLTTPSLDTKRPAVLHWPGVWR